MDYGTFNGLYTLFLIVVFVALILWVYSKKQKKSFEDMGKSIFDQQDAAEKPKFKKNSEQSGVKK